ncbi:MAG: hypothetical protein RRZ73_02820 [Oscillospiraceae bacterium]
MAVNRFGKTQKKHTSITSLLLPVLIFVFVMLIFLGGLNSISQATQNEQLKSTKQAVIRAAVQCYATEGVYPATLDILEQRYGLTLDHEKFVIDYQCFAANIMPDVTVIPRN